MSFGIQSNPYGVNSITSPRSHGYTRRLAALGNVSTTLSKKVGFRWLPLCASSLPCLWTWWSQRGQTSMPSRPSHGTASQAIFSFNIKLWLASCAARWSWAYWQGLCCDLISSCDPKVKDFYSADYEAFDFLVKLFGPLGLELTKSGGPELMFSRSTRQFWLSILGQLVQPGCRCSLLVKKVTATYSLGIAIRGKIHQFLPVFRLVQAGTTGCPFVILNRHVSCMSGTFTECMFQKVPHCGMCVVSEFGRFDSLLIDKFVHESVLQIQPENELLPFFPFENPCCIELQNMSFCSPRHQPLCMRTFAAFAVQLSGHAASTWWTGLACFGFLSVSANTSFVAGRRWERWCFQRPIILHPFNHNHSREFSACCRIHSLHSERPHLVSGVIGAALSAKCRAVQDGAEVPLGRMWSVISVIMQH